MKKILVAEDDAASRELLAELLAACDYRVIEACDGQDALQKIEQEKPDLLLLDIQMPVLDGMAVLQRVRQDPRYDALPVVALSAYAMRGDREKGLSAGFDAYLTKPIDIAALTAQIRQLLA
jgi:CheY-like chemotaxis protein